jgi:glycosyltransferase involved in cell wall biosynthesis
MLKITYLITVYNKSRYIGHVIDSLKRAEGDFNKEYVFINDGSNDNSLNIIYEKTADLENVTIINQSNKGPSVSTNAGIKVASGDYVHFVDGDDIISSNSTSKLLDALISFNCSVAFSLRSTYDHKSLAVKPVSLYPDLFFIEDPIKALLVGKVGNVRGLPGALVRLKLLKKIGGCDEEVFVQDFSLALRCAKLTKFVKINESLYYCPQEYDSGNVSFDKNFERRQSLLTIHNFIRDNQYLCDNYSVDFYKAFWSIVWKMKKNFPTFVQYIKSKIVAPSKSYEYLLDMYKSELIN